MSVERHQAMTRRQALAAGTASLALPWLAACGSSGSTNGAAEQRTPVAANAEIEDRLLIGNWVDFQDPQNLADFARENSVKIVKSGYGSEEELLTKLAAGGSFYDLVVPGGSGVQQLRKAGLAQKLNRDLIPNVSNLKPEFDGRGYDPGNAYSIPKDYGITSFYWRPRAVRGRPQTLADAFELVKANPDARVNFIESSNEVINAALAALGRSINTTSSAELDDAKALLLAVKPGIDTISTSYLERGQRGEIDLGLGYSGDVRRIRAARRKADDDVEFLIPGGRCQYFVDLWVIPSAAKHPVAAHRFIDFILDPRRAGRELAYTQFGSPVRGAEDHAPPELAEDPIVAIPPAAIRRYETAQVYTPAIARRRNEIYAAFKAA